MSGKNLNMQSLGVGMFGNDSQYATGARWHHGSQVRWHNGMLEPVGGWTDFKTDGDPSIPVGLKPIRDIFSWRDLLKAPYVVFGSADNVHAVKIANNSNNNTYFDITPVDLDWEIENNSGFGSGFFGAGYFGLSEAEVVNPDREGQWSFQDWGRTLVGVHNQDGRLFQWDPQDPSTPMQPVIQAPTDNTICVVTDEEFLMVMGGKNNPAKVEWCSRRNITDWVPTETNSAGGFDLQTNGSIVGAQKVQGGVLVITTTDVHLVEYVGPPNYYGRRLISEVAGGLSKNSIAAIPGGAIWLGVDSFWKYDGNITELPCTLSQAIFDEMRTDLPTRLFIGHNEHFSELWVFYPNRNEKEPTRYLIYGYGSQSYWSMGEMPRTAWAGVVYKTTPIAVEDRRPYNQETGFTAAGESRVGQVWVESGAIELSEGDTTMRVDRIYQDFSHLPINQTIDKDAFNITFELRQAPSAPPRIKGPITLNKDKGYTNTRLRARQITMRVDQVKDTYWTLGKLRLRAKPGGGR